MMGVSNGGVAVKVPSLFGAIEKVLDDVEHDDINEVLACQVVEIGVVVAAAETIPPPTVRA